MGDDGITPLFTYLVNATSPTFVLSLSKSNIIIIIIITHTKIGAQQKKKYINDYMDQ